MIPMVRFENVRVVSSTEDAVMYAFPLPNGEESIKNIPRKEIDAGYTDDGDDSVTTPGETGRLWLDKYYAREIGLLRKRGT